MSAQYIFEEFDGGEVPAKMLTSLERLERLAPSKEQKLEGFWDSSPEIVPFVNFFFGQGFFFLLFLPSTSSIFHLLFFLSFFSVSLPIVQSSFLPLLHFHCSC